MSGKQSSTEVGASSPAADSNALTSPEDKPAIIGESDEQEELKTKRQQALRTYLLFDDAARDFIATIHDEGVFHTMIEEAIDSLLTIMSKHVGKWREDEDFEGSEELDRLGALLTALEKDVADCLLPRKK